jgi:Cu/Ag efflux protein CusF
MKKIIFVFLSFFAMQAFASSEWVNGEVVRVDQSRNRIILKHEYIPSIKMSPMTMPFGVVKEIPLSEFQKGDKVRIVIRVVDGSIEIIRMEKIE